LNKIKKIYSCFQPSISTQEIDLLQNRLIQPFTSNQLSQNFDSFFFFDNKKWQSIPFSEIIYLQGDGSYTTFFTNTFSKKISRNLKTNGAVFLTQPNFVRIHNKYIVNTNYIETVIRGLKPQVILKNHITLAVSLRQRDHLFSFMGIKKSK
jgi:DNA-binding LytR/AlgR family response regulator